MIYKTPFSHIHNKSKKSKKKKVRLIKVYREVQLKGKKNKFQKSYINKEL